MRYGQTDNERIVSSRHCNVCERKCVSWMSRATGESATCLRSKRIGYVVHVQRVYLKRETDYGRAGALISGCATIHVVRCTVLYSCGSIRRAVSSVDSDDAGAVSGLHVQLGTLCNAWIVALWDSAVKIVRWCNRHILTVSVIGCIEQWRTQEFCSEGVFNKFSWGQRAERTEMWRR
jgi:hypothetical protein